MTAASGTVQQHNDYRLNNIELRAIIESSCGDGVASGTIQQNDNHRLNPIDLKVAVESSSGGIASGTIQQHNDHRLNSINLQALEYQCGGCEGVTLPGGQGFPDIHEINLGPRTGEVWFNIITYSVPDKFAVNWNSTWVIETGFLGNANYDDQICEAAGEVVVAGGYNNWYKFDKTASSPQKCYLYAYAPLAGTAWRVQNYCPGDEKDQSEGPGPQYCTSWEEEECEYDDEGNWVCTTTTHPPGDTIELPELDNQGNEV